MFGRKAHKRIDEVIKFVNKLAETADKNERKLSGSVDVLKQEIKSAESDIRKLTIEDGKKYEKMKSELTDQIKENNEMILFLMNIIQSHLINKSTKLIAMQSTHFLSEKLLKRVAVFLKTLAEASDCPPGFISMLNRINGENQNKAGLISGGWTPGLFMNNIGGFYGPQPMPPLPFFSPETKSVNRGDIVDETALRYEEQAYTAMGGVEVQKETMRSECPHCHRKETQNKKQ